MTMPEKMLSIKDFALLSNYSERLIRQYCLEGKIEGAQKLSDKSRKWLIPQSALEKFKSAPAFPSLSLKSHEAGIFEKSDNVLNEPAFEKLFDTLKRNSIFNSQLTALVRFLEFFEKEGNKYTDWHLNYLCLQLCQSLFKLSEFIQVNSIEKIYLNIFFEKQTKKTKNKHPYPVLKNILDNTPIENYDESPIDDLYLVLDERSHQQIMVPEIPDIFNNESYLEWQREYDDLIATAKAQYKEYRSAIRQTLSI
ncbi:MAG: hypothetical protein WAU62_08780 [Dehalococcoidales bacterium]